MMRQALRAGFLGLLTVVLAACAGGQPEQGRLANADRTELLARLQLGQPVLDCREACLATWKRVQPQAEKLDAAGSWDELAVLVIRTGYQDDLSLYYLGRAAEGRGFYAAATSYYRQSTQLSGTSIACANLSRLCGNVSLPKTAAERLAAAERLLAAPKKRKRPTASRPATAEPAALEAPASPTSEEPAEAAAPPLPPAPAPALAPAVAPPSAAPSASKPDTAATSDFIEPPPAAR